MARINKVEACLFCGQAPCRCNEKPKAAPKKRAPKAEKPTPTSPAPVATPAPGPKTPGPDFSQARRIDQSEADSRVFNRPAVVIPETKPTVVVEVKDKPDPYRDVKKAIVTLMDFEMLDRTEVLKYERRGVRPNPDPQVMMKVNAWKERNRGKV